MHASYGVHTSVADRSWADRRPWWDALRSILGTREQPRVTARFRGTLAWGNRSYGPLEVVATRVPIPFRIARAAIDHPDFANRSWQSSEAESIDASTSAVVRSDTLIDSDGAEHSDPKSIGGKFLIEDDKIGRVEGVKYDEKRYIQSSTGAAPTTIATEIVRRRFIGLTKALTIVAGQLILAIALIAEYGYHVHISRESWVIITGCVVSIWLLGVMTGHAFSAVRFEVEDVDAA
jgi:hypothetical protein